MRTGIRTTAAAFAASALFCIAGCSQTRTSAIPPSRTAAVHQAVEATGSQPTVHNRFADAINVFPEDGDVDALIEKYIDPSVTGADRALAHTLMKLMPAGRRGDFLYYDGARLLSNNPALVPYAKITARPKLVGKPHALAVGAGNRVVGARRRTAAAGQCSPQDPFGGTGPYVRNVSNCGFNGGWGIVNLECGTTSLNLSNDQGYMYMEARDEAGNTFEGGLFTPDGSTIDPYEAGFSQQLNNATARYSCNSYIGVMFGEVNAQIGQYPTVYASMGTINNYNPANAFLPNETVTEQNPAWFFVTAPGGNFNDPGTDAAGVPTPCRYCSITKVTSIAQRGGDNSDGSTFGIDDDGNLAIHWNEVTFGEWLAGCAQGSLCQLEYSTNSGLWYAGEENYPNQGAAYAAFAPNGEVYESYDGVIAVFGGSSSARRAGGAFTDGAPPSCTPDSYGYCQVEQIGGLGFTIVGYCRSVPVYGYTGSVTYVIQTTKKALVSATESYAYNFTSCRNQATWTPYDPKVQFSDPNLP
jgi:hypothetical protein